MAVETQDKIAIEEIIVDGYERVIKFLDPITGLKGMIAVHNTKLGPALGGTRIYPYASEKEALFDVLRLSRGMTHKSALAEVGLGGGKSVIFADAKKDKTPELMQAFGRVVESLGGLYICAEDYGCTTEDCQEIRKETKYVVGLDHASSSGNPAPFTAWGVFHGIQATLKAAFGDPSVVGKVIAIQGLGSVGMLLSEILFWHGAKLIVSDIDSKKTEIAARQFGAKVVSKEAILSTACDLFSPNALGAILNKNSIPKLNCRAVAGAANNQLLEEGDAELLMARGILYAPDFVINAGGVINVSFEMTKEGYQRDAARDKVVAIYDSLSAIYKIAMQNKTSTLEAAHALVEHRLRYGIGKRVESVCFHH
jgi:leucine dehydrogenase